MKINKNCFKSNFYELLAWDKKSTVFGVDEVGRGCLAGPVVAASIVLLSKNIPAYIKDSKALNKTELLTAYDWLKKNSQFSIGIVNNDNIDKLNIWNTTLLAMKKSVIGLFLKSNILPDSILIDSMPLNLNDTSYKDVQIYSFDKGESKSVSIAAASIVAKVTRDKLIEKYDIIFPGYNFTEHKGYGTAEHKNAIEKLGNTIIHRKTFLTKSFNLKGDCKKQLTIF